MFTWFPDQGVNILMGLISEIERSSGDIDLGTIQRSDYAKFDYGRPTINKIKDHNIMGVNYELGSGGGGPTMKVRKSKGYQIYGM